MPKVEPTVFGVKIIVNAAGAIQVFSGCKDFGTSNETTKRR
jgi:hypothetical protein